MANDMDRFLTFVVDYSDWDSCWLFRSLDATGYGQFQCKGKKWRAHRWMYSQFREIPTNYVVDHLCRNRACVNPEHLEAVTHTENMRRAPRSGGMRFTCKKGHVRTEENTYIYYNEITGEYKAQCTICRLVNQRRWVERKRSERNSHV